MAVVSPPHTGCGRDTEVTWQLLTQLHNYSSVLPVSQAKAQIGCGWLLPVLTPVAAGNAPCTFVPAPNTPPACSPHERLE